jgi:hypothetical protein
MSSETQSIKGVLSTEISKYIASGFTVTGAKGLHYRIVLTLLLIMWETLYDEEI